MSLENSQVRFEARYRDVPVSETACHLDLIAFPGNDLSGAIEEGDTSRLPPRRVSEGPDDVTSGAI
jgi:hypothetical protein